MITDTILTQICNIHMKGKWIDPVLQTGVRHSYWHGGKCRGNFQYSMFGIFLKLVIRPKRMGLIDEYVNIYNKFSSTQEAMGTTPVKRGILEV